MYLLKNLRKKNFLAHHNITNTNTEQFFNQNYFFLSYNIFSNLKLLKIFLFSILNCSLNFLLNFL